MYCLIRRRQQAPSPGGGGGSFAHSALLNALKALRPPTLNPCFANTGGGGGPGGGGGGSFVHYDALDVSKDGGHEGHGCAEVLYVAPSARSLRTQMLEAAQIRSCPGTPKNTPRRA